MLIALLLAWLVSLVAGEPEVYSKYVTTDLDTTWNQTPFHMEAAEFLHESSPDLFWDFVDDSCRSPDGDVLMERGTDQQRYEAVVSRVESSGLLSMSHARLLRWALALRVYSPRVQWQGSAGRSALSSSGAGKWTNCSAFAIVWPLNEPAGSSRVICSPELLEGVLTNNESDEPSLSTRPHVFDSDHVYSGSDSVTHAALVYGSVGEPHFCRLHATAAKLASSSSLKYILRHFWQDESSTRVRLSGYAVQLAIKSTEYKAQDDTKVEEDSSEAAFGDEEQAEIEGFIFSKLNKLHGELSAELNSFQRHLILTSSQFAPLKVWQLQQLSLQAATRILHAADSDTLQQLAHISQNFPSLARSLIRTQVEGSLTASVKVVADKLQDSAGLQMGQAALFINGMMIDPLSVDVFSLLETIRSELKLLSGLSHIGLDHSMFERLVKLYGDEAQTESFAVDFRDSAVHWLNDVAHDKLYSRYPSSLRELLRPSFGGMLRVIRRNMYHVVVVLDPTSVVETLQILNSLQTLYEERMPMTMGVVWSFDHAPTSDVSSVTGLSDTRLAVIEAFNYIVAHSKSAASPSFKAVKFIVDMLKKIPVGGSLSSELVHESLKSQYSSLSVEDVFGAESEYDTGKLLASQFVKRLGLNTLPQVLFNGVPIPASRVSGGNLEEALLHEMIREVQKFMSAVMGGELTDEDDVVEWITSQPHFMPRLNERILSESPVFVELTASTNDTDLDHVLSADLTSGRRSDLTAMLRAHLRYMSRPGETERVRAITLWPVADLDTERGRKLLHDVLVHTKSSHQYRCALIVNPGSVGSGALSLTARAVGAAATLPPAELLQYLLRLSENRPKDDQADWAEQVLQDSSRDRLTVLLNDRSEDSVLDKLLRLHTLYVRRVLSVPAGARALVVNGRMLGPLGSTEDLGSDDLELLERFVMASGLVERLRTLLVTHASDIAPGGKDLSDVLMETNALLSSQTLKKTRYSLPDLSGHESVIQLPPADPSLAVFDIVAVCDPVSREAQHIAPLLSVLRQVINARIQLVLNPKLKHSDMPLSSYYRLVLEPEPQFSRDDEQRVVGAMARFTGIPDSPILTQHYHVPDNWIIAADRSVHDLDNIRLGDTEFGVHSDFLLESLLVEGHCFEQASGGPPRGLQITLEPYGSALPGEMVDTIVMANLGYFQLKANPGLWTLQLREGRSRELFDLLSLNGVPVTPNPAAGHVNGASVLVDSFSPRVVKLRVAKKPDRMSDELLEGADEDSDTGIWNSIKNTFSSSEEELSGADDVLNIFSLASGHLYERLMRIMILSVLKHTRTPVKFWFLKNYLSPSFKDLLGPMSKEYGFDYELVQYNWPRWLHQQTDKQRIIWGYKILFLDVLFPLNVKKIIFVDADQIVRADLKELRDLDLERAPYGYTPFCDSRKEMDGFRFWNQGYWRHHLQGRKYHISALYVVDLKKFRQVAAGDRLRGQYQGLSQDPNSLSNLDQDLPNNMIHQVRIKSLPQEWLWCETWCDDSSKQNAKTIDLCNNPMTKEAKLDAAARIVPEWTDYDTTIRKFIASLKNHTVSLQIDDSGVPHNEL